MGEGQPAGLADFVAAIRPRLPALVEHLKASARTNVPDLELSDHELHRLTVEHLDRIVGLLAFDPEDAVAGARAALAPITVEFATEAARRGAPAELFLRVYQNGHAEIWRFLLAEFGARVDDLPLRITLQERASQLLFAYVSAGMRVTVETHAVERDAWARGMSSRQRELVRALLSGGDAGDVARLSQRLGYDLGRRHVGFVAWTDDATALDHVGELETSARHWVSRAGGGRPLLVAADGATLWGWCALDGPPAPRTRGGEGRVRIAVGQPASGLDGFRVTHREALAAQRVALDLGVADAVVHHAQLETTALLGGDLEVLRRYVEHQLGALAAPGRREAELRGTLRLYLDHGTNASATAAAGHLHRNTLARRVRAAERLRGRPLDDDRLGLAIALEVAERYAAHLL